MLKANPPSRQKLERAVQELSYSGDTLPTLNDETFLKWSKRRVRTRRRHCEVEAQRIERLGLGHASIVLPSILRCLVRQLEIVLHTNLPLEAQAAACRIAYEMRDRTSLMAKQPELISEFLSERWHTELEMLQALQLLHPAEWNQNRQKFISSRIQTQGLQKKNGTNPRRRAELNGRKKEHEAHYRLISLYCHATGMLATEEYQTDYQLLFIHLTQQYAWECLMSVSDCVQRIQKRANGAMLQAIERPMARG